MTTVHSTTATQKTVDGILPLVFYFKIDFRPKRKAVA
jgi:hypothetical protein